MSEKAPYRTVHCYCGCTGCAVSRHNESEASLERCVVCNLSLTAEHGGLCDDHRYDEQRVEGARRRFGESSAAYYRALDERQAVDNNDREAVAAWHERVGRLGEEMARAEALYVTARRAAAPSFDALLADPTQQFDPKGDVLASITAYRNAKPATACVCGGSLHPGCGAQT